MITGSIDAIKTAKAKIEKAAMGIIEDKLREIARESIMDRVYGAPASEYHKRAYSLLDAVNVKFTWSKNKLSIELYMSDKLISPTDNPEGFNSMMGFDGTPLAKSVSNKFHFINEGHHRKGTGAPRFMEKIQEQILNSTFIEETIAEALSKSGWGITIG
jgi:hypothetical protein